MFPLSLRARSRRNGSPLKRKLFLEPLEERRLLAVVSSWKGDGDALDSVGPNDGTMLNGATFAAGLVGQGFEFDGIDDQFSAPTAGLPSGSASRTVELWTRVDGQTTEESFFASYGTPGTSGTVFALGRLSSGAGFVSNWGGAVYGGNVSFGVWHHVAASLESDNQFRLYLDGVQVSSGSMNVSTPAGTPFYLGRQESPYGASRILDGMADEVNVHDRALTATEIQAIFAANGGAPTAQDDAYVTRFNASLAVAGPGVLMNDSGQLAALVSGPAHGTLSLNSNGGFTYTPTAGYSGPDSFTYHAVNGAGNSNLATVSITVSPSAAGDLDSTFGGDGTVVTDVGTGRHDRGEDVALQSDGKLVVGGWYQSASKGKEFGLVRYNSDGSLDGTFGNGGIVRTSFGSKDDAITGIAIQSDGKIVAGGYATVSNRLTFAVARYNTNGTLDKTFDGDGKVTTNVVSLGEEIKDIMIQPDGKIVAVGNAETASGVTDFALVRYNANGSLDTSFGVGGKVTTPGTDGSSAVALQADGKIVVAGSANPGEGSIARYNTNGTLDTSFAGNGLIEATQGVAYRGLAIQTDGGIVVAANSGPDSHIARFDANGNVDPSMGGDGTATSPIDTPYDVAIQPDGKIVTAGQGIYNGDVYPLIVTRSNSDGTLDTTFGSGGVATAPMPPNATVANSLAIQPDGKIVAAGFVTDGSAPWMDGNWNTLVARFEGDASAAAAATALTDEAIVSLALSEDWLPQRKKK